MDGVVRGDLFLLAPRVNLFPAPLFETQLDTWRKTYISLPMPLMNISCCFSILATLIIETHCCVFLSCTFLSDCSCPVVHTFNQAQDFHFEYLIFFLLPIAFLFSLMCLFFISCYTYEYRLRTNKIIYK